MRPHLVVVVRLAGVGVAQLRPVRRDKSRDLLVQVDVVLPEAIGPPPRAQAQALGHLAKRQPCCGKNTGKTSKHADQWRRATGDERGFERKVRH
jgi:hypothetical protein